jgi:HEAT repeat protein
MRARALPLWGCCVLSLLACLPVCGDQAGEARPILEQWRDVLRYGIDSEVLKVVPAILEAGETSLNGELARLFAESLNLEVRKAVLDLLGRQQSREAEQAALALVSDEDLQSPELATAVIRYLSAVGSEGLAVHLPRLLDDNSDLVAEAAIDALSQSGSTAEGELALEKLKDMEYPESRKPELILALGKLKYAGASEELIGIVSDRDAERVWRMYAAISLGELGDSRAVPALKAMFSEQDSLVRAYAAAALAKFDMGEVEGILQQGLRDGNVKVRVAAAEALANEQAVGSVEILMYKVRNDPEPQVRLKAIQALGVIGTRGALEFLRGLYRDSGAGVAYREAALATLCDHDLAASVATIEQVVEAEWGAKDQKVVELTAKMLSGVNGSGLTGLFERLLGSRNVNVRIYALRGIERNGLSQLRSKVEAISAGDPYPAARQVAARVLEKL